jgi:hypothetical protein
LVQSAQSKQPSKLDPDRESLSFLILQVLNVRFSVCRIHQQ